MGLSPKPNPCVTLSEQSDPSEPLADPRDEGTYLRAQGKEALIHSNLVVWEMKVPGMEHGVPCVPSKHSTIGSQHPQCEN